MQNSINFYPLKKALGLEGRNKEKKDLPTLFMKMAELEKKVSGSENNIEKMHSCSDKIAEKVDDVQDLLENNES